MTVLRGFCLSLFFIPLLSATPSTEDELLVRFRDAVPPMTQVDLLDPDQFSEVELLVEPLGLYRVRVRNVKSLKAIQRSLEERPEVKYTQRNHFVSPRLAPNDPEFAKQWSLHGKTRANIGAEQAWDYTTGGRNPKGQRIVVAVIDDGMDIAHPDLKDNIWVNRGEIAGNGVDDDGNGYIDDVHGWNGYKDQGDVSATRHGTHVAGIIGARGNNGTGTTGINWNVDLMAVAGSSGKTSIVSKAYGYVLKQKQLFVLTGGLKGANVVATNSSFGVDFADCESGDYPVWNDLFDAMGKVGILSAAATANRNVDVDARGDVPTGCTSPYLITVTNTTKDDEKYGSAGYGAKAIDLGAPGTRILSSVPGGQTRELTGTSMATPHVAGAVGFLHSVQSPAFGKVVENDPAMAARILKRILLQTATPLPTLASQTVSGGRLDLGAATRRVFNFACTP